MLSELLPLHIQNLSLSKCLARLWFRLESVRWNRCLKRFAVLKIPQLQVSRAPKVNAELLFCFLAEIKSSALLKCVGEVQQVNQ